MYVWCQSTLNNTAKPSNNAFGGPIEVMQQEGQKQTFCRNARQIYCALFVSNSRKQPVGIDPSLITAYAPNAMSKCN